MKGQRLIISLLLLAAFLLFAGSTDAWYDSNFKTRINITINNTANANSLVNYPVQVNLSFANINSQSGCKNFQCVRFADSSDNSISFFRNQSVSSSWAEFWLNISSIPASSYQYIYAYFNNTMPVSDAGTNPMSSWLNWTENFTATLSNNSYCSYCKINFPQNTIGAYVQLLVSTTGDPKAIFQLHNDTTAVFGVGGGTGTNWFYTHDTSDPRTNYKVFASGYTSLFNYTAGSNYTFIYYANATYGPRFFNMTVMNDTVKTTYNRSIVDEGGNGQSGNVNWIRSVALYSSYNDSSNNFTNIYSIKIRKLSQPEPVSSLFATDYCPLSTCIPVPIPDRYCADNYTLIIRVVKWNGTSYTNNTLVAYCPVNGLCNNQSFFGPNCDPPAQQQTLWLIASALGIFIFLGVVYKVLNKVF